jgi:ATP-dependent RNA helicase SUPV3L1/SUV3
VSGHSSSRSGDGHLKAVLGPTNTGKTHLAIERLCAHSSGAIGFPLRLLAREVYDRVRAIKGDSQVALITGEERIEPPQARWLLCTVEAMPRSAGERSFIALDEAQLAADPERGHIFTDRLLNARGRDETMILGSATLEPMIKALMPKAEIITRPRFSSLTHVGPRKLSRLPPRSAIVAFSSEQVYAVAEMLRRFRGGAAVVMGALSPETRNRQVELFQSGEVDYIVATDAIGMGLNLDVGHVAFAGLSKFDGTRKRRLTPAEMAQIAGRAGRHHKDGTFGTLAGGSGPPLEFTDEEVHAIEEHRFAPLTRLFWRETEPRFDRLDILIDDLEARPEHEVLAPAPEAIDLAVLKRLAQEPAIVEGLHGPSLIARFWDVCCLPDFRQQGVETHSRFVARLWQDLSHGYIGADFAAARIAELDNVQGDIDTLQGRIAAMRSWSYIAQRPDWLQAKEELAARARGAEARLSDALHARLTERFVNRRTAILMKAVGKDPRLLKVELTDGDQVLVEGEVIGHLEGFRFSVDASANHADRKLLLAAAEKHLPDLLARKAAQLVERDLGALELSGGNIVRDGKAIATVSIGRQGGQASISLSPELSALPQGQRKELTEALELWLDTRLKPLLPLRELEAAARDPASGSEVRALLLAVIEGLGVVSRDDAGLEHIPPEGRKVLRRLGVTIGALDIFVPGLLKPAARRLLSALGMDHRPQTRNMEPVLASARHLPAGYRLAGKQALRVDMAERVLRDTHERRAVSRGRRFTPSRALAISMGLAPASYEALLREAGFRLERHGQVLAEKTQGPPVPELWSWRPRRKKPRLGNRTGDAPKQGNAFAALAGLVR